jgi:exonuclease SbcC
MRLVDLTLKNFRSFVKTDQPLDLAHNVCLLYGPNGAGKTSLFDAIELALTGNIGRLSHLPDIAHYLVRAQSPEMPASTALHVKLNGEIVQSNLEFRRGDSFDNRKGILSPREIESFRSTCYLSQSTIRSLVTCDSATLGRIIEAIIIDESSDVFIQGLLAANITRTSSQFAAARQRVEAENRDLRSLNEQLTAAEIALVPKRPQTPIPATQIAALVEQLRLFSLPTEPLNTNAEIGQAITLLEEKITQRLNEIGKAKAGAAAGMSTIQALIDREQMITKSRTEQVSLQARRQELGDALVQAHRDADAKKEQISVQRNTSADIEKLISALKLLQDSQALSGDQCPVCDQVVTNLEMHVSNKLKVLAERNRAVVNRIERLAEEVTAATDKLIRLSTEYSRIDERLSEIDRELAAYESRARETLNRYMDQSVANLDSALDLEKRRMLESSETETQLLSIVQLCSALRSSLAIGEARAKGVESKFTVLRAEARLKEARLSDAQQKFQELELFVKNIQELRQELATWRTQVIESFAESQANEAFGEFFSRIVPRQTFGVGIESASVVRNKPQVEWRAFYGAEKYVAEGVLSQAELNACAIALFLALATTQVQHPQLLLFDDPVQNMDELHIEEFGQTLKLLKDTFKWQIIIGVHDLSVYNFFKRQLYPSREGQSLCSYILSNSDDHSEISTDRVVRFEPEAFDLSFGAA